METFEPHRDAGWVVQPLLDAGVEPAEICVLMTRLGFEAIVPGDGPVDARVLAVVADRPQRVRTAWVETIDRMTARPLS